MLDDLVKGVREYISDRFMSPLGASLTASWCGWNFKFILIALSGEPVVRKLHLIRMVYQDHSWTPLLFGPIATAAVYLFLFPFPSRWVYAFTLKRRREALDTLRRIERQTPLTQEESQALRDRFSQIEMDHLAEKLRLNNSMDSLKEQLDVALKAKLAAEDELLKLQDLTSTEIEPATDGVWQDNAKPEPPEEKFIFSATHLRLLRLLATKESHRPVDEVAAALGQSSEVVRLVLGDLIQDALVEKSDVSYVDGKHSHVGYQLTPKGVRYLLAGV
ncbi:hypothetical protein [Stenotrophomonas nematodicola]|uniref:Uncharacterized protein n=1 Tax=Stenotrophomonas nematodicola TaxID=2656746 RepID=A0ABW7CUR8_9GAMM